MSRYFLAIVPPESTRTSLAELRPPGGKGIKRVSPEHIHLTLHYLGELSDEQFDSVISVVKSTQFQSFPLSLRGLGTFPHGKPPRVLWTGIDESRQLSDLHSNLGHRLTEAIGFKPESRRFHPHITLARIKASANLDFIEAHIQAHQKFSLPSFEVHQISLFQSRLSESGAMYDVIATN
ncbi:MAG: RNA 2',3'-cyclic phosphodiesterase [Planctomycetaceae bacterium]|nr:RNA 2',3'-cyclic phosphodiesterase [Planctomycetaceae bacterium]